MVWQTHGCVETGLIPWLRMWKNSYGRGWYARGVGEDEQCRLLLSPDTERNGVWRLLRKSHPAEQYRLCVRMEERWTETGLPFLSGPWNLCYLSAFSNPSPIVSSNSGQRSTGVTGPPVTLYISILPPTHLPVIEE